MMTINRKYKFIAYLGVKDNLKIMGASYRNINKQNLWPICYINMGSGSAPIDELYDSVEEFDDEKTTRLIKVTKLL
jgi:hypothetical protein